MNNEDFNKVDSILNKDLSQVPQNIKVEKKERGLYERTNTILITEDNKMMLND